MQLQHLALAFAVATSVHGWSPSNGYAPGNVTCDSDVNFLRSGDELSTDEQDWLKKRNDVTKESLQSFLKRATANFTDTSIFDDLFRSNSSASVPKIGIAASGGGYRAMLSGAGMIAAMDNRTEGANDVGLGGLLQSSTYLAGLSGGNWLVGTLAWNNWTSVQTIVNNFTEDDAIWDISHSIVTPGGINIFKSLGRWDDISDAVHDKQDVGFNISLTDVWGRALSYNFFPSLHHGGDAYTWSTLRDVDVFKNAEMPFPISVADGRYPGTTIINSNATIFEFNPFEMGSWDPTLNAFTDVKYLGTNVTNGTPVVEGQCIEGFDNTGFIMGTSSSLFNQFLLQINSTSIPSFLKSLFTDYLNDLAEDSNDISIYAPNPFKDSSFIKSNYSNSLSTADDLYLVDGGEDLQNVPLLPLIQQKRNVDVIFALDNSADTENSWPNGTSLVATYERQFVKQGNGTAFPYVPDVDTFVNLGLNKKPTFFGCDASNMTDLAYIPPLIVYIPNSQYSFNSNQSTFKLSYSTSERLSMIENGFEAATRGNLTESSDFLGCVACAIVRRQQESTNATLPAECETCFSNYCWDGTISSNHTAAVAEDDDLSDTAFSSTSSRKSSKTSSSSSSSRSSSSLSSTVKHSGGVQALSTVDLKSLITVGLFSAIAWLF
ncbi:hypothetical protein TPHA_0J00500 [Tetrapisispora phaffii CBS 4417]|uniref:Lysophospholipase n=1 Tax=Tetrapisispora phaffii (strain ATCC 24235 / CBS 4417 / NBRC 1672 / NRRL Y-8282 / UCD 70-5) TaxID=1071381 RepID=G8BYD1_TETPH|nr:hypothetical protein TPHA_0J00500 [Tetrapisispora phaffii CBS 4417]CCE64873.1 hypothetical protein TPHA_0J00500 [Tetrapisispora phaffii CBS 4417]